MLPVLTQAARAQGARRLVVVLADGGWDSTFVFDPKLDAPEIEGPEVDEDPLNPDDRNVVGSFGGLDVLVNEARRRHVTTFFENWGSRCCILNGLLVGSVVHDFSRYRILTGTRLNSNPDMATITGHVLGADLPLGSIDTSGLSLPGSLGASAGRLGSRNQLGYLLDPALLPEAPGTLGVSYPQFQPDDQEAALLERFLDQRVEAMPLARAGMSDQQMAFTEARLRAGRLVEGRDLLLGEIRTGVAQTLRDLTELAVGLLANDVCRAVTIDSGFTWDTHTRNIGQHGNFNGLFEELDVLVQGLHDRGLLEDTIVAVVSEMSRTPRRNADEGKDHWPTTSALLLGGPVRGGRVLGATDNGLDALPVDLATGEQTSTGQVVRYDHFAAGVLAMLDIDPGDWLPGVEPYLGFVG